MYVDTLPTFAPATTVPPFFLPTDAPLKIDTSALSLNDIVPISTAQATIPPSDLPLQVDPSPETLTETAEATPTPPPFGRFTNTTIIPPLTTGGNGSFPQNTTLATITTSNNFTRTGLPTQVSEIVSTTFVSVTASGAAPTETDSESAAGLRVRGLGSWAMVGILIAGTLAGMV